MYTHTTGYSTFHEKNMAESTTQTEKDSDIPEDCDICNYAFTKTDRCPKILPCGHTICAHCINTLVKTNPKTCPKCRMPFEGRDATDFATRMAVINKITLSDNKAEIADLKEDGTAKTHYEADEDMQLVKMAGALKEKSEELYQTNLTKYDNTELDIQKEENYIAELKESLLALNVDIKSVTKVLKEVEDNNVKMVFYLEDVTQRLKNRQKIKTERVKINEEYAMKIPLSRDLASLGPLVQKFKELSKNAKEFEQDLKTLINKSEEIRISIQKDQTIWRENIDRIQAIPSFKEEGDAKCLQMDLSQELAGMKSEYDSPMRIKVDDLLEMPDHIRRKIKEGKIFVRQVFEEEKTEEKVKAGKEEGGKVKVKKGEKKQQQRIGRVSINNEDDLLLHHMTEDSLSLNSYVVEYSDIMQMVDSSSRLTFINFEIENFQGRVFFRLSPDTKIGMQFFLMCSGEMGTSYADGERDIEVGFKINGSNERLRINVNETLLKADWRNEILKDVYKGPQVAGTLQGYYLSETNNGVFIFPNDKPDRYMKVIFGKIYKGLEVVERLCTFAPSNDRGVSIGCRAIKDCGVVIPLPNSENVWEK